MGLGPMRSVLLSSAATLAVCQGAALAQPDQHHLRGLFCNTEAQIDATLALARQSFSVEAAVKLINTHGIVCNFADKIEYVVVDPIHLGRVPGAVPIHKYQATLIAVVVGGNLRPVDPPVTIFFAGPIEITGAPTRGGASLDAAIEPPVS